MLELATPIALPAVFETREQAEAVIEDLKALGLTEEEIGVVILELEPGRYRLLDEEEHDELLGLMQGVKVGVPAGVIAGIALGAFAIPGIGTLVGSGGLAMAAAGAWWGAICGAWAGLTRKVHWNEDEEVWVEMPVESGDVVVITKPGHHYDKVHHILEQHGARYFLDPSQPEHPLGFQPTA